VDDPPIALLEDFGNVRIAGRLALEKARLAALVGPIKNQDRLPQGRQNEEAWPSK
jgi:hypothetical protein